jgi:hypothetical protein
MLAQYTYAFFLKLNAYKRLSKMKKTLTLLMLLLLLSGVESMAQNENPNALQLSWGVGNLVRQDLTFNSIVHRSTSPLNVALTYSRSQKWEQRAFVKFGQYSSMVGEPFDYYWDTPDEPSSRYPHSFTMLDVNYSLGKSLIDNGKWKLIVGGKAKNDLHISYNNFAAFGHFGYYLSFGLDAWVNLQFQPGEKHAFQSNLSLPLASYISRSPYTSQNDEYFEDNIAHNDLKALLNFMKRGSIQSWGQSQTVDFDLSYFYQLSKKWEIGGSYYLSMNFNQTPTHYASIEQVLSLSGKFNF